MAWRRGSVFEYSLTMLGVVLYTVFHALVWIDDDLLIWRSIQITAHWEISGPKYLAKCAIGSEHPLLLHHIDNGYRRRPLFSHHSVNKKGQPDDPSNCTVCRFLQW